MGYDMTTIGDELYFRANIWGMGDLRMAMERLGMLSMEGVPEWPDQPEGYWDREEAGAPSPEGEKFEQDVDAQRTRHAGVGIAAHKLCSNDGWVVTPEEIDQALILYDAHPRERVVQALRGDPLNDADVSSKSTGELVFAAAFGVTTTAAETDEEFARTIQFWDEWVDYLRQAQRDGGFRVW